MVAAAAGALVLRERGESKFVSQALSAVRRRAQQAIWFAVLTTILKRMDLPVLPPSVPCTRTHLPQRLPLKCFSVIEAKCCLKWPLTSLPPMPQAFCWPPKDSARRGGGGGSAKSRIDAESARLLDRGGPRMQAKHDTCGASRSLHRSGMEQGLTCVRSGVAREGGIGRPDGKH